MEDLMKPVHQNYGLFIASGPIKNQTNSLEELAQSSFDDQMIWLHWNSTDI